MPLFVFFLMGILAAALVENRGLHIAVESDRVGVRLEPATQPASSLSTYGDASPIVTGQGAVVTSTVDTRQ